MYPAKLLLFGEHILLLGAPAVAMPVPAFMGQWAWRPAPSLPASLSVFVDSLATICPQNIDVQRFSQDVAAGIFFDSNIPVGYGLGSSGALCAAVYDRYGLNKTAELAALKTVFAGMEGYFHGHSSGIDPLTSYLGQPILIEHTSAVELAEPRPWAEPPVVFLIDSRLPRQTGPLVQWFLAQSQQPDWRAILENELLPAHETMVGAWLAADSGAFWPALRQVSQFQFRHFQPMVPATLRALWSQSFDHPSIALKICGAGGGGFLLGFARDRTALQALEGSHPIILPFEKQVPLAT